jgi:hypothetical protein
MFNFFRRATPEEKERLRLAALLKNSRSIEGNLTDTTGSLLYYTYEVRGVTYHAAQDVAAIEGADMGIFNQQLGPVTVRYSTTNPANSMVLSQEWSGFKRNQIRGTKPYVEPIA